MAKPTSRRKSGRKKKRTIDPFASGFWAKHWREAVILFGACVALYTMTLPYEFVLDDQIVIKDNNFTKKGLAGIPEIFAHDSFTGYFGEQKDLVAGSRYRPLSLAMFAAEYELVGEATWLYHLVNSVCYGLLCLLIFRVLSVLLIRHRSERWYLAIPFLATLLFALHPVHTEAVANIKGRDEILAMLGAVGALYAVLRYVYRRSLPWLLASGLIFFLGLLAKENTITFLAVIPLALYFFTDTRLPKWAVCIVPAVVATVAYLAVRISVIGYLFSENTSSDLLNNPFLGMTTGQHSATVMYTLGEYVRLLVFPHPLTHDYYPYHVPVMDWGQAGTLISLLIYLVLAVVALAGLRRKWIISFCILYFVATLSVVSNVFFPIGTFMNERFAFMPSLAFCLALPYYLMRLRERHPRWQWVAVAVLGLYVAGFAAKSVHRIPTWRNALSLNTSGIAVSKNSARANCFYGTALYNEALKVDDREERLRIVEEADAYVSKALSIIPNYLSANQMKSGLIAEYYRYDRDLDKLLKGFEEVLSRKPNVAYIQQYMEYLNNRGRDVEKLLDWYYRVGYEILSKQVRRYDYAHIYLNYGLQLDPNNALINWAIGRNYLVWGDPQRGNQFLEKAYQLDPALRQRE